MVAVLGRGLVQVLPCLAVVSTRREGGEEWTGLLNAGVSTDAGDVLPLFNGCLVAVCIYTEAERDV